MGRESRKKCGEYQVEVDMEIGGRPQLLDNYVQSKVGALKISFSCCLDNILYLALSFVMLLCMHLQLGSKWKYKLHLVHRYWCTYAKIAKLYIL